MATWVAEDGGFGLGFGVGLTVGLAEAVGLGVAVLDGVAFGVGLVVVVAEVVGDADFRGADPFGIFPADAVEREGVGVFDGVGQLVVGVRATLDERLEGGAIVQEARSGTRAAVAARATVRPETFISHR
ncbi:hypothetical protein [Nonomuraea candida]|uniref:hypothetical protein n=1 Tax=Nonomuraea candida TaxID=359159 RepID=UPI0014701D7E|nr:hypothetical protein [Nonomuraea candida]